MSKFVPLSKMTDSQSVEHFIEGVKRAASCARLMSLRQRKKRWLQVALLLEQVAEKGGKLTNSASQSRSESLTAIDLIQKKIAREQAANGGR
jgi:hypothetical protein